VTRARIWSTEVGVAIEYADEITGERVRREFRAPLSRCGYVREGDGQVCEGLYSTGRTLESTSDGLLELVRREWRRRRRTWRVE
jgi:hypothetical protein